MEDMKDHLRLTGAIDLGGPLTADFSSRAIYRNRVATATDEREMAEMIIRLAVYELVMRLRHFQLHEDVLAALQMPLPTLGSAFGGQALAQAFPQTAPGQ